MLHDVATPSAFVESLQKAAAFTNATAVFHHAG
jgi:hypothetical protein